MRGARRRHRRRPFDSFGDPRSSDVRSFRKRNRSRSLRGDLPRGAQGEANAVDVGADGSIIVGGSIAGNDFGLSPAVLGGTRCGSRRQSRVSGCGGSSRRIGARGHDDLAYPRVRRGSRGRIRHGDIAIAGAFGAARLDPSASSLRWVEPSAAPAERVSLGSDGVLAALGGKTIRLFDDRGTSAGTIALADDTVEDIAVDGATHSVFVAGSIQAPRVAVRHGSHSSEAMPTRGRSNGTTTPFSRPTSLPIARVPQGVAL